MSVFHVSVPVDPRTGLPRPRGNCSCGCATRSKASAPVQLNAFEKRLRRTILAERKKAGVPAGVPRAPVVTNRSAAPAKGTNGATRPSFGKDSASLRTNSADRRRVEAFAPESSLLAHLRANGKDTSAAEEMLAENAARHVRAMRAPAAARPMSERDRKRAAEFIPPSSLDVWKAQQTRTAEPASPRERAEDFALPSSLDVWKKLQRG